MQQSPHAIGVRLGVLGTSCVCRACPAGLGRPRILRRRTRTRAGAGAPGQPAAALPHARLQHLSVPGTWMRALDTQHLVCWQKVPAQEAACSQAVHLPAIQAFSGSLATSTTLWALLALLAKRWGLRRAAPSSSISSARRPSRLESASRPCSSSSALPKVTRWSISHTSQPAAKSCEPQSLTVYWCGGITGESAPLLARACTVRHMTVHCGSDSVSWQKVNASDASKVWCESFCAHSTSSESQAGTNNRTRRQALYTTSYRRRHRLSGSLLCCS